MTCLTVGGPSYPVSWWKRWHGFGWPFCISWECWALQVITSLNKVQNHSFSLSYDCTHQPQLVRTSDEAVQPHLACEPRRGEKRSCHFIADMECWLWQAGPCCTTPRISVSALLSFQIHFAWLLRNPRVKCCWRWTVELAFPPERPGPHLVHDA